MIENLTRFVCFAKVLFRELNVERNVQSSVQIIVLEVGHSFALLADASSRPGSLLPLYLHDVAVEMLQFQFEANQSVLQADGDVRIEVVTASFVHRMWGRYDFDDEIARFTVHVGFALGNEAGFLTVLHARLDFDLQHTFLVDETHVGAFVADLWKKTDSKLIVCFVMNETRLKRGQF